MLLLLLFIDITIIKICIYGMEQQKLWGIWLPNHNSSSRSQCSLSTESVPKTDFLSLENRNESIRMEISLFSTNEYSSESLAQ